VYIDICKCVIGELLYVSPSFFLGMMIVVNGQFWGFQKKEKGDCVSGPAV